jgi:hypothetical protein
MIIIMIIGNTFKIYYTRFQGFPKGRKQQTRLRVWSTNSGHSPADTAKPEGTTKWNDVNGQSMPAGSEF